jgi:hypothetical protein
MHSSMSPSQQGWPPIPTCVGDAEFRLPAGRGDEFAHGSPGSPDSRNRVVGHPEIGGWQGKVIGAIYISLGLRLALQER